MTRDKTLELRELYKPKPLRMWRCSMCHVIQQWHGSWSSYFGPPLDKWSDPILIAVVCSKKCAEEFHKRHPETAPCKRGKNLSEVPNIKEEP